MERKLKFVHECLLYSSISKCLSNDPKKAGIREMKNQAHKTDCTRDNVFFNTNNQLNGDVTRVQLFPTATLHILDIHMTTQTQN